MSTGGILQHGVVRARGTAVAAMVTLDVAILIAAVVVAVLVASRFGGVWLVLALAVSALAVWSSRTGMSPAAAVLGLRIVDATDTCPPGLVRTAAGLFSRRLLVADRRRGRDPLAVPPMPPEWSAAYEHLPPDARPARGRPIRTSDLDARRAGLTLSLDSGQHVPLTTALVIGRNPDDVPADARPVAWPDLSRTLSKAHARLDWDGSTMWVTDLGSTNGSAYEAAGKAHVLPAMTRTAVPLDAVISMGERTLTVIAPSGAMRWR